VDEVTLLRVPGLGPGQQTWYAVRSAEVVLLLADPDVFPSETGQPDPVPWDGLPPGAGLPGRVRDRAAADLGGLPPMTVIKLGWSDAGEHWLRLTPAPN
jgi:hypothetical protein